MRILVALVGLLVACVGLLLLLVHTERGRALTCSAVLDVVNGAIPGAITAERCSSLTPGLVRVEGVGIVDPGGREIAQADAVEAEPDWPTMLSGVIGLVRVRARAPRLTLAEYGDELAIVAAFVSPTDEPDDPSDEGIDVVIDSIEIDDGRVTDLPNGISVSHIRGKTNLAVRATVSLDVEHMEATTTRDGEAWVRVVDGKGALRFGDETGVDLSATLATQGETAVVETSFEGTLERFSLDATVQLLGGDVTVSAHQDAGRLDAQLDAADLNLGRTPWVERGVARSNIHAVAWFSEPTPTLDALDRTKITGNVGIAGVGLSGTSARQIDVSANVDGRLPTPAARVVVQARGVELAGDSIERLQLVMVGENGRYSIDGHAPLPNGWVVGIDVGGRVEWPILYLDGKASLDHSPWSPVRAEFSRVVFEPAGQLSLGSLAVVGEGIQLSAQGRYSFEDKNDVSFSVGALDLARLARALDLDFGLAGVLAGSGRVGGTSEQPEFATTFRIEEGRFEGESVETLNVELAYTALKSAHARVTLELQDRGTATLRADAKLKRVPSLSRALRTARYDARLAIDSLPVEVVGRLVSTLPSMHGILTAEATAQGSLDSPNLDATVSGERVSGPGLKPTDVQLSVSLQGEVLNAAVDSKTQTGGEMHARARGGLSLPGLLRGVAVTDVADEPWEISVQIPEQPWSSLPIDVALPIPTRFSLDLQATGGNTPITGDVNVDLKIPATTPNDAERLDSPSLCPAASPARARVRVRVREGHAEGNIDCYVAHERVLRGEAEMETPLVDWAQEGFPTRWPAANIALNIKPIELAFLPTVCGEVSGTLQGRIVGDNLFQPSQDVSLRLEMHDLRIAKDAPTDVVVEAKGTGTDATAKARVLHGDEVLAEVFAHVPLDAHSHGTPVALGAGEMSASANFDKAPLAVLLGPLPWVARPSGFLTGNLRAAGDARDLSTLKVHGEIKLAEASMTLKDPFVRLDDVHADLRIDPDQFLVRSLSVQDRDGRVDIEGRIQLSDWEPTEVELALRADKFPLRRAGVVMGTFNGRVEITGDLSSDPRTIRLALGQEVSLVLPENVNYSDVQDLSQHPLVIYRGQPGFDQGLPVREALRERRAGEPEGEDLTPLIVRVRSSEPFWVRRPDFSLQLSVDLNVHSEGRAAWLVGSLEIRRGFLALLNKNFDVQSGSIHFTGATPVDPTVDLSAKHRLNSGYSVTVNVRGSVSNPELTFSSDAPDANTDAEIVALLLGTSRPGTADTEANDQTQAVLAGLTAGLVGSIARRELGQYAPILAVESGGSLDTTGVRAGFTIGDLIPEAWQGVVLGVYVEGLLSGSEQGPRGGLLLELLFPHYLSTTTTYEQPDNWSLDFLWQP
ncbi:MAG: translocation/assembly module TamB domain-containing protein [Polyangiales bacterium]